MVRKRSRVRSPPEALNSLFRALFTKIVAIRKTAFFYVSATFQITPYQSRFCFVTELYVSNNTLLSAESSFTRCGENPFETFSPAPKPGFFALTFQITLALRRKQRLPGSGKRRTKREKRKNGNRERPAAGITELPLLFLSLKEVKGE